MPAHAQHHYVPEFLLKRWHSGLDDRLTSMRWAHGQVRQNRYKAHAVAKHLHLYSTRTSEVNPNVRIEREYMAQRIDDPASTAHRIILSSGLTSLTEEHETAWTRFLVSLVMRVPAAVRHIQIKGRSAFLEQLDKDPDAFIEARGDMPEESLRVYVEKNAPEMLDDFGKFALPHIIETSSLNKTLFEAHWELRQLSRHAPRFVIGDRPLTLYRESDGSFLYYLPLSPDVGFFAFNDSGTGHNLRTRSEKALRSEMNHAQVQQAHVFVYGTNGDDMPLVRKHLRRVQAAPGLGMGL